MRFDKRALMHMWRYAVIAYLREALQAEVLTSELAETNSKPFLTTQYQRWWNIDIDRFQSKKQFLRYAGRYVRRPPATEAAASGAQAAISMYLGRVLAMTGMAVFSRTSASFWFSAVLSAIPPWEV